MKRKLGIMAECIKDESPLITLERIKKAGFDSVFISSGYVDSAVEIADKARSLGLDVNFIHAPFRDINAMWANDDSVPEIFLEMKKAVDMAQKSGVPTIIAHVSSGWNSPELCDKGLARFDELVDYAEERGIIVAFENLRKVGNVAYFVDRYKDRDNVRFCYDSGHEHGYTVHVSFADIFREKIICTHIHDNLGLEFKPEDPDLHMLPFDGNLDFEEMMRKLNKYSYEGPLSLEVWNSSCNGKYLDMDPDEFIGTAYERILKISEM